MHGGNHADETTGAIRTPSIMANLPPSIRPDDHRRPELRRPRLHPRARRDQRGLEEKLAKLDRGEAAAVFGTGMAALHAAFFTILNPGDHAIVSSVVYMRVAGLLDSLLPAKLGIDVDFVDVTDLEAVRSLVRPNSRLIHTEVVANPDLRVADIATLAKIAHEAGALLTGDSTFTPPPMLRPLELGADLAIHSLTKYYNGHGDAMGGVVIGDHALVEEVRCGALHHIGGSISPFNAWLIMRGSTTLPLRLQRQFENAQAVAEFLADDPRIAHVSCPGLPSHPQHMLAATQFTHRGGFLRPRRDPHPLRAIPRRPRGRIRFRLPGARTDQARHRLESKEDLIADLDAALTTAYGPAH